MTVASKIIVALDFSDLASSLIFVAKLDPLACRLKVGKELFTACGPEIIHELQGRGFEVFLDLKFHDIPSTVYKSIRAAATLGVWMVNVHVSGGREMLQQAQQAVADSAHQPWLIGVTLLTSLSAAAVAEIGYTRSLEEQVLHLAQLAYSCGLGGVVCAAAEANLIKQQTSPQFLTITPGIRLESTKTDDQTRIMTPTQAVASGADYLVIGRPITEAANPAAVIAAINHSVAMFTRH